MESVMVEDMVEVVPEVTEGEINRMNFSTKSDVQADWMGE